MSDVVLYGSGTIGRLIARQLIAKGTPPVAFADNDQSKWGTVIEGIHVNSPIWSKTTFPNAKWIATAHRTPSRDEILADIEQLKVESISLYEFIPAHKDLPPSGCIDTLFNLLADVESVRELSDQIAFREKPATHKQRPPSDIAKVYFEDFFTRRDDEHFVDCGAADGDTIAEFIAKWQKWDLVTAFEPDKENYQKAYAKYGKHEKINVYKSAVSDCSGMASFISTGDQTAHIGHGNSVTTLIPLDKAYFRNPPTFIKMDVEGVELEALWGARNIISKHSPVLAVCAYHIGDHLWQIPLLIHALNPGYRLYLRRYLEATWEILWYAVPPDRVIG
jgi:FkbM family methyltransferase